MKIQTVEPETLSTGVHRYDEISRGVYLGPNGKLLIIDGDGRTAILIERANE